MDFLNKEKKGVAITENLLATQFGGHIYSLVDDTKDVENASFGFVGKKIDGERELSEFITPDAGNIDQFPAVLVATPPEIYYAPTREGYQEYYFVNEQEKPMRAFSLHLHDEFAITEYSIDLINDTAGAQKGNYCVLQADSNRVKEVVTPTGTEGFVLEIIDVDSSPLRPHIMINSKKQPKFIGLRVVKNQI